MYMYSVYKEFPRYKLSIEIKDHKFGDLEHFYITITIQNLGTSIPCNGQPKLLSTT